MICCAAEHIPVALDAARSDMVDEGVFTKDGEGKKRGGGLGWEEGRKEERERICDGSMHFMPV
jgi:hypothetical protein